ncbi:MAG: DUF362 domain-containing protein [Candidatus Jordarchaeaceae archaeon]
MSNGQPCIVVVKKKYKRYATAEYKNTFRALGLLEENDYSFKKEVENLEGKRILVKICVGNPPKVKWVHNGSVTSPYTVQAILDYIIEKGASDISIGEGPSFKNGIVALMKRYGFLEGLGKYRRHKNVKIIDLGTRDKPEERMEIIVPLKKIYNNEFAKFKVNKVLKDFDLIINVAKIKTHGMTGISGAVKNYFGFLEPPWERWKKAHVNVDPHQHKHTRKECAYCYTKLSEAIAQIAAGIRYSLNIKQIDILDGVVAGEWNSPHQVMTAPREDWVVLGGYDSPASIDKIAAEYMGYTDDYLLKIAKDSLERRNVSKEEVERLIPSYKGIYHIKLASEFGLGTIDLKKIKVIAEFKGKKTTFDEVRCKEPFDPPETLYDGLMTTEYNKVISPDEYFNLPLYRHMS